MRVHGRLRRVRSMLAERRDDASVFGDDRLEPSREVQAQEAHPVDVRFLALHHAPDVGMAGDIGDQLVHRLVRRMEGVDVLQGRGRALAGEVPIERGDVGGAGARCRRARGEALERIADHHRVLHDRDANGRDEGAALRIDVDELLLGKPEQRLAHRRAADPKAFGEFLLRQRRARRQFERDDPVAQRGMDAGRRGHRPLLVPSRTDRSRPHIDVRHRALPSLRLHI